MPTEPRPASFHLRQLFNLIRLRGSTVAPHFASGGWIERYPSETIALSGLVGKVVMAAAAKHLSSVTLELGGKSPVIIDEGANIEKIAADLAEAKQFNGGQACICPDYVFVKEEQKARLVDAFQARVKENLYADGKIKKEAIAQIVNKPNFTRVKALFDDYSSYYDAAMLEALSYKGPQHLRALLARGDDRARRQR